MIRNESEYQEASRRLLEERERLSKHRAHLEEIGLESDEVKRALDPLRAFHAQLVEEVESYERLKRGEFWEVINFDGLGRLLIALRIASGIAQRQLAERLGVNESQVSRDERNEYHGASVDRVRRVLEALRAELRCVVAATEAVPLGQNVVTTPQAQSGTPRGIRLRSTPTRSQAASFQPHTIEQVIVGERRRS